MRALRLANEIRSARARLKKDLGSGKIELAQILAQPPECVRTANVRDVLLALPKIGSVNPCTPSLAGSADGAVSLGQARCVAS